MTKPFDLELAKAGYPVETRDGCKARIMCFDCLVDRNRRILALVYNPLHDKEFTTYHDNEGKNSSNTGYHNCDLVMSSIKKKGWINVCKSNTGIWYKKIYSSKQEAIDNDQIDLTLIDTIEIEWEE